jgi:hypothetical protein
MTNSKTAIPKDLIIELSRTMCPGACPDYSVFIYGNGRIVYEGRRYVAVKGRREGWISRAQVKQLLDQFYKANYFSLKERYDALATVPSQKRQFLQTARPRRLSTTIHHKRPKNFISWRK